MLGLDDAEGSSDSHSRGLSASTCLKLRLPCKGITAQLSLEAVGHLCLVVEAYLFAFFRVTRLQYY